MALKVAVDTDDILGEGPVWSVAEQALYWVDIDRPALHRWQPATEGHMTWALPSQIGCFALKEGGGAIVALRDGLYHFDLETHALENICRPEATLNTRFNDGKCDRHGRFWAGTMDIAFAEPIGALYRYDGQCRKMRAKVSCSNGLGWSPDNRTMYYTDSPTKKIVAYDFDLAGGEISNERTFAQIEEGFPDGLTVDAEGYVWSAHWNGWQITRYAPDGSVDQAIPLPVQRPTSCTFGGPNMDRLFITTATVGLSSESLAEQPLAGKVLVWDTAVTGIPEPLFKG